MSGNKVNTKTKGKDDKAKASKVMSQNIDENEEDFTLLRKPVITSITGFAQARKLFDLATEELKELLTTECDLLYECKVCRNIFRSLVNFISHKRIYCKEKFNTSVHGHFIKSASTVSEFLKIKKTEDNFQQSLINGSTAVENEDNERIPMSKDLTEVVENIGKIRGLQESNESQQVTLQKIQGSSVAVFQNLDLQRNNNMRTQVNELDYILSKDQAVLNDDGKFTIISSKELNRNDSDNVIQISDDEEGENGDELVCKLCDLQFSTQKTLKFHMKYKHLESRLVYPCPDCLEIFSTSWSVYRHLFKVHRKTAAQIRRLRESIQAKAFKMNNPPAFYERRKNNVKSAAQQKISEEERVDQENQAWLEGLGAECGARCAGCGRHFERRAALHAHAHTCLRRHAAKRPDKKIEIQIRKDYNKGPTGLSILKPDLTETKMTIEETTSTKPAEDTDKVADDDDKDPIDDDPMDVCDNDQNSNGSDSPEKNEDSLSFKPDIRLPFAAQAEKSNFAAFKQRVIMEIDSNKLLCKKCDTTHKLPSDLYQHMAGHFKWMRYACKLCNFKHYDFDNLPEHVKTVHKLKGDNDFYSSTVKAIDGTEAMIISRCLVESEGSEEAVATAETSPDSRRPSRCSSDSSRLSDDSSSSSTLKEVSTRKRKMYQGKIGSKKKKPTDDGDDRKHVPVSMEKVLNSIILGDKATPSIKNFEENSSDVDEVEEKLPKKTIHVDRAPVPSRRPVRKRTRPKNEDFEYDLSNLLKMEAQGYRDSQSISTTKTTQSKKKPQPEAAPAVPDPAIDLNKDCCGALVTLSKKSIDIAAAHMKPANFSAYFIKKERPSNVFVRPMLPKILARSEKISPRKDLFEESSNQTNVSKSTETASTKNIETNPLTPFEEINKLEVNSKPKDVTPEKDISQLKNDETVDETTETPINPDTKEMYTNEPKDEESAGNKFKHTIQTISSIVPIDKKVVPLRFRRQSIEVMKNPIINKNITDFTKAGMKTKILVIKPINRSKDRTTVANSSMKYQTIKLKDPNKTNINEDKSSEQNIVLVKVPKVDCTMPRMVSDVPNTDSEHPAVIDASHVEKGNEIQEKAEYFGTEIASEQEKEVILEDVDKKENNIDIETDNAITDVKEPANKVDGNEAVEAST